MSPQTRFSLYVLISAASAAAGLVLTEVALRFFSVTSLTVAFLSNIAGGIVLLAPTLRRPDAWRGWAAADWLRLSLAAFAVFALGFFVLYTAIGLIGSAKSSLLGRLEVVFVIALAGIFLREHWSGRHWAASLLALGGAVLINFDPVVWQLRVGPGELLSVLAAFIFSAGIVTLKPLLDRRDPQVVTGSGLLMGALFLMPLLYGGFEANSWMGDAASIDAASAAAEGSLAGGLGWLVLSILVVRGALLGVSWATYNIAMRHLGASRCSVLFLTLVIFTIVLQVVIDALAPALGLRVPSNLLVVVLGGVIMSSAIVLIHRQ